MKKLFLNIARIILGALIVVGGGLRSSPAPVSQASQYLLPTQSCTVIYGSDGDAVYGGNNEDFINPLTQVWFVPAEKGRYGQVYFGFDDGIPQGAVNDQGLFYDGLSVPYKAVRGSLKPLPLEGYQGLLEEIFATAKTVEQVQEIFTRYNLAGLETSQLLFGDRFGRSIIVDGDTITPIEGKFQVATNFHLADYASSPPTVDRFDTATRMLSSADRFSVELFRDTLDATHQEGEASTLYSQVYDLKNNRIYLYQFYDYQNPVVLDIAKELAKGPHAASIASLFPKNQSREDFALPRLRQYEEKNKGRFSAVIESGKLDDFVGEYRNPANRGEASTRVTLESGKLYLQKTNHPASQLFPAGKDVFSHPYFYPGEELEIRFTRDASGKVSGGEVAFSFEALNVLQTYQLERIQTGLSGLFWILAGVIGVGLGAFGASRWMRRSRRARIDVDKTVRI